MQNWTYQKTISTAETYAVQYRFRIAGPPVRFETRSDSVSFASTSEVLTEYTTLEYLDKDGKRQVQDVVANTISTTTTCVGAANPTRWKSKLEAGSPAFPGALLIKRTETFNKYIITQDGPVETEVTTYEYEPRISFAGGLSIENYKSIDLGVGNILLRKTIVQKEQNKSIDLTKQTTVIYEAWGATSAGKTVAASIMAGLKREEEGKRISGTYTLVDRMSALVCRGVEKTINIGRGTAPAQPNKLDQENERLQGAQDRLNTNGSWNQFGPLGKPYESQNIDLSFGSAGTNSTDKYNMQFAPDSYLRPATDAGDNGTGLKYVYVSSATAAYEYGRAIHYILSGMANGKSITTELRNIPSEPMGTLYLEAAGTVGRFRANGTTFAWDSQGLVVGCDAMLDGGAGLVTGATGADWFPMMVAATNLPTVTATANSTPALANTITAPGGFDPMAPGNIWASFGTAGVEGDVYAADLTRASVVGAVAENVRRESVSRSLTWVLEAPYSLTATTESITSVSVSYGTALVVHEMFAGSGSGVIADLSAEITPEQLYAGSGSGVIASLSAEITPERLLAGSGSGVIADLSGELLIEPLLAGSGSGVIADLSDETLVLLAGSGSGVITDTPVPNALLLHMDGSNGSTTFTDSSSNAHAMTVSDGVVTITTAQSKFGGASGEFAGDLRTPTSSDFTFDGDFTIELWVRRTGATQEYDTLVSASNESQLMIRAGGTELGSAGFFFGGYASWFAKGFALTLNTWQHVAMVRSGSTVTAYVDGVSIGTTTSSATITCDYLIFGDSSVSGRFFKGQIDEVRVTNGKAHYTSAFTPPSAAFPNE
jgi:hypothetical protein